MSDVNLPLVREFFELNLFRVMTNWQQDPQRLSELTSQLFVEHGAYDPVVDAEFLLEPSMLQSIERAVVEVRAWHADRFYPSVIEANPVLSGFVSEDAKNIAIEAFGTPEFSAILVISELPTSPEPRSRAINLLQNTGINHIIEFPTLLRDLLTKVSIHGTYAGSQTLQLLRLLKRYRLTRHQQMEFTFPFDAPHVPSTGNPPVPPTPNH